MRCSLWIASITFPRDGSSATGLWLDGSLSRPRLLKMGVTTAFFQSVGNLLVRMDKLKRYVIDSVMGEAHPRRTRFVMILSAVDFVVERRLRW